MLFYLGTHEPAWLPRTRVPLFVSRRRLARRVRLPRAAGRWALDSGGFSELSLYGYWRTSEAQYAREACTYLHEVGGMDWAAPQDWMCEPTIIANTGLSVREHQLRTIDSVLSLRAREPQVPWVPVLQGWTLSDYVQHVEDYAQAGLNLRDEAVVGLGSVCRRQATEEAAEIVLVLTRFGLRLHGFGFKTLALVRTAHLLTSSDSMAWSFDARYGERLPSCTHAAARCNNCMDYALQWRTNVLAAVRRSTDQYTLWGAPCR